MFLKLSLNAALIISTFFMATVFLCEYLKCAAFQVNSCMLAVMCTNKVKGIRGINKD